MKQKDKITVKVVKDTTFEVTVQGERMTTHRVSLSHSYYEKLTHGLIAPELLVKRSFQFLLERESNTSILSQFDLPLINRYFPEYEATIQKMLGKVR